MEITEIWGWGNKCERGWRDSDRSREGGRQRMCVSGCTAGHPCCCNQYCYIRASSAVQNSPDTLDLQDGLGLLHTQYVFKHWNRKSLWPRMLAMNFSGVHRLLLKYIHTSWLNLKSVWRWQSNMHAHFTERWVTWSSSIFSFFTQLFLSLFICTNECSTMNACQEERP